MALLELTVEPDIAYEVEETFDVDGDEYPSPVIQRREGGGQSRRKLKLEFPVLSRTERAELVTLFRACRGKSGSFTFTHEGEDLTVQFAEDRFRPRQISGSTYSASTTVETV